MMIPSILIQFNLSNKLYFDTVMFKFDSVLFEGYVDLFDDDEREEVL